MTLVWSLLLAMLLSALSRKWWPNQLDAKLLLGGIIGIGVTGAIIAWSMFEGSASAGTVPLVLSALLVFGGLILVKEEKEEGGGEAGQGLRLLPLIGVLSLYLICVPYTGYYCATACAFVIVMATIGERRALPMVLLLIGWLSFVYLVFDSFLHFCTGLNKVLRCFVQRWV